MVISLMVVYDRIKYVETPIPKEYLQIYGATNLWIHRRGFRYLTD